MFGIGHWEVLILGLLCLGTTGAIAAVVIAYIARSQSIGTGPNLMPCPECKRMISRLATTCPQCGHPLR